MDIITNRRTPRYAEQRRLTPMQAIIVLSTAVLSIAGVALLLASCADALDEQGTAGQGDGAGRPIVLTLGDGGFAANDPDGGQSATRADKDTGHGENGTTLREGEQFSVWFTEGSTVQSAVYQIGSDKTTATAVTDDLNRQPYYKDGATSFKLRAYYPVMHPMAPATFTVSADQHVDAATSATDNGYIRSDLMYAALTSSSGESKANLTFRHRMAMLTVQMTNTGVPITACDIVDGCCRTVNIADPETLTPGTKLGDPCTEASPLKIWYGAATEKSGYGWHASCLVPPQRLCGQTTVGEETRLLRIKHSDGSYTYFTMGPKMVKGGYHYTIRLTLAAWMKGKTLSLGNWEGDATTLTYTAQDYTATAGSQLFQVGGTTFRMVKVTAGTAGGFTTDEDYWMGETEVTNGLWAAVMGSKPAVKASGATTSTSGQCSDADDYPVTMVQMKATSNIIGSGGFLEKLNTATASLRPTGYLFALPTADQWVYAALGGRHSKGYAYCGGSDIGTVAWYSGNAEGTTHPVAQLRANELGLYDMSGNVQECLGDAGTTANTFKYAGGGFRNSIASGTSGVSAQSPKRIMDNYDGHGQDDLGLRVVLVKQ